jgi:hypothetical protein
MTRAFQVPLLLLMVSSVFAWPGDNRAILTIDEKLSEDIHRMEVEIQFGFGEILLERGNPSKAVTGFIQYDEDYIRPYVNYEAKGGVARFRFVTKSRHEGWESLKMRGMNEPESELYFTTRVPLEIDFECGLGKAKLNLGELKIADLVIENGLGETELDFAVPNRTALKRISVENGLGELTAFNLSNSRAEKLKFDCGLGSAVLDFRGELMQDMDVDVNVGLGSVELKIPEGYNVVMEADENFLSTIDTHGLTSEHRGYYRSRDYRPSRPTLHISASVGLGSIDIKWVD